MKRYTLLDHGWDGNKYIDCADMVEREDGEWVKWEDVKHLLQSEPPAPLSNEQSTEILNRIPVRRSE